MNVDYRQRVVVGIIYNQVLDSILIAKRPLDKIHGGLWEFPGGKSRHGETDLETLSREIFEETGITVIKARRIHVIDYDYADVKITLSAWVVDEWSGVISEKEGQLINWSKINDLSKFKFPEANKKLIKLLNLPMLYLITPDLMSYDGVFFNLLSRYLDHGLKLIQFRSPSLKNEERLFIAEKILKKCESYNCKLIFNGNLDEAKKLGAHGVHLTSKKLLKINHLKDIDDFYVAGSCHSFQELKKAKESNLDFCVISPVNNTESHSDSSPLGWEKISVTLRQLQFPAYALGGLTHHDTNQALMSGCYGISMITGVWGSQMADKIIMLIGNRPSILLNKNND